MMRSFKSCVAQVIALSLVATGVSAEQQTLLCRFNTMQEDGGSLRPANMGDAILKLERTGDQIHDFTVVDEDEVYCYGENRSVVVGEFELAWACISDNLLKGRTVRTGSVQRLDGSALFMVLIYNLNNEVVRSLQYKGSCEAVTAKF
jgi:hypothetical protein